MHRLPPSDHLVTFMPNLTLDSVTREQCSATVRHRSGLFEEQDFGKCLGLGALVSTLQVLEPRLPGKVHRNRECRPSLLGLALGLPHYFALPDVDPSPSRCLILIPFGGPLTLQYCLHFPTRVVLLPSDSKAPKKHSAKRQ